MSPAISDGAIVAVLRPFVRATRPVLDGLREFDPFGLRSRVDIVAGPEGRGTERGRREKVLDLLASIEVPGTPAWASMDTRQHVDWWVYRLGRFTTLLAAVPGIGGVLANRLPVSAAIGAAAQGLLLVAIAGEHGVRDEEQLVALLGAVLFRRELVVRRPDAAADAAADVRAAELTGDLRGSRPMLLRVGGTVWRLGRALFALDDELDKRPHGNAIHRFIGNFPVVGAVGKYLGEWSGLKHAAREADEWLKIA